ncbi:MAG: fibronectin type III domain-containing protein, partial [Acidobacteria bacterium]|nr:fibronectin type III domain-containing protein [Acidobacteriota bacterium]
SRVIPGDGEIAVEWQEPDYSGGAPIESYSIEAVPEGSNELPTTVEVEGDERAAVVRGLVNGVKYKIVVTAYSQGGFASVESDAVSPSGMSEPPVVFVESVGDGFADVRIENPVNTGGLPVESYTVTTIPAGGTCTVVNQRCRVTGLTNGVGYVVAATLTTAGGTSRESLSWSFTPLSFLVPQLDMAALTPSQQPPTVSNPIAVVADVSGAGTPAAGGESSSTKPANDTSTTTPGAGTQPPASTVVPTTVPTTVSTPAGSSPALPVGQKIALRTLLSVFKVSVPKGSTVSLDTKTSGAACTVTKKFVAGTAAGTCRVGVVLTPTKGKARTVTVTIQVVAAKS